MKKIFSISLSLILALALMGCSLIPSVELTENEQKVIAEYAAGLLLKHDKNYAGSIQKVEEEEPDDELDIIEEQEAMPAIQDNLSDEGTGNEEYNDPEFSEDLTAQSELPEPDESIYSDLSIAEAIGIDGFDIIYKSYEVQKIYPPQESEELIFSLEAAPGMDLLILHFGITNDMADRSLCDILDSEAGFRLEINGGERVQAQKTMLLNDLSSYYDEVEGYGMVDAVLVFELSEGSAASIESMNLIIKQGGENTVHRLR